MYVNVVFVMFVQRSEIENIAHYKNHLLLLIRKLQSTGRNHSYDLRRVGGKHHHKHVQLENHVRQ